MTDPRHDDTLPRDPRFDQAWAAVSDEAPPPALDAAILAAARREVGAGPREARAAVAEATRPERWWFPLAAAATIGAIALGVLQVVGTDGVFSGGSPAVVSDLPPETTATSRGAPAPKPDAPPGTVTTPQVAGPEAAAPTPVRPPVRFAPLPTAPADTVRPAPRPLPPPAAAAADKAEAPQRDAVSAPAGAVAREATAGAAPDAASDPRPPVLRFVPSPAPAPDGAVEAATVPAAPPAGSPPISRERTANQATAAQLAATPPERARADAAPAARGPGALLPVPEWIALIRRLRDEGRIDDAVKELSAFRRAHPDHRLLLPADLVEWRIDAR
jgi:hypothetical protein